MPQAATAHTPATGVPAPALPGCGTVLRSDTVGFTAPAHATDLSVVVLDTDDRVLLTRNPRDPRTGWGLPCGPATLREDVHTTATALVADRTGVHIRIDRVSGAYRCPRPVSLSLVFLAAPTPDISAPGVLPAGAAWVGLPTALVLLEETDRAFAAPGRAGWAQRVADALAPHGTVMRTLPPTAPAA